MKILFVCLGNICRSPTADGIMRHLIRERGLDWTVDSAGTGNWHTGKKPDARTIRAAAAKGIDLSVLRARQFSTKDFQEYDRIYAMDLNNLKDIQALASSDEERSKVELFLQAASNVQEGVRDPYYDDGLFAPVLEEIWDACEQLLDNLTSVHSAGTA